MSMKTLVSPLALAFGLSLTGAAAAQTWVGTQEIDDADLPAVEEHCETLALSGDVGADLDVEADADADAGFEDDAVDAEADVGMDAEGDVNGELDLESITLQDCIEAGLADDANGVDADVDGEADFETDVDIDDDLDTGVDADVDAELDAETDL